MYICMSIYECTNRFLFTFRFYLRHTTTDCHTLQHAAPHCNTRQTTATHTWWSGGANTEASPSDTVTHCNTLQTLQETAIHCNTHLVFRRGSPKRSLLLRHSITLQKTATHCNTLQKTATHTWWSGGAKKEASSSDTATHCKTLQHTATHCNTLQHTPGGPGEPKKKPPPQTLQHIAKHCNILQNTATHTWWSRGAKKEASSSDTACVATLSRVTLRFLPLIKSPSSPTISSHTCIQKNSQALRKILRKGGRNEIHGVCLCS